MPVTKTFEPIRPLRCKEAPAADSANMLGTVRTFYGETYWPSYSYAEWVHHDFAQQD